MKRICVVAFTKEQSITTKDMITQLYYNYIEVDTYTIYDDFDTSIYELIVMTVSEKCFNDKIGNKIKDEKKIMFLIRTFSKKSLEKISLIPARTKVLFVNNTQEATYECLFTLRRLGIRHIELFPYYPGIRNYEDCEVVITPNEQMHVPSELENIINVDERQIDAMFFIAMLIKLEIFEQDTLKITSKYMDGLSVIGDLNKLIHNKVANNQSKVELIIDKTSDGIISYKSNGSIDVINKKAINILEVDEYDIYGIDIRVVLKKYNIEISTMDGAEYVFNINGKNYLVTRSSISDLGDGVIIFTHVHDKSLQKIEFNKRTKKRFGVGKYNFKDILGRSDLIKDSKRLAKTFALTDYTILIEGESGTGKELFASAIHNYSFRKDEPFIVFNCAALSDNLVESELFGYEKGSFTGANKSGKIGLFEKADRGSIFLDEIGDLPKSTQVKVLRVLQEKEITRVGGTEVIPINIRVIAATNRDLLDMVNCGDFRKDLFYRLNVLYLELPNLNDRIEDLVVLLDYLKEKYGCSFEISDTCKDMLLKKNWEGNIRELENIVQYLCSVNKNYICINDLPKYIRESIKTVEPNIEFDRISLAILTELLFYKEQTEKIGRGFLTKVLCKKGIICTEHEIRHRLLKLSQSGYVMSKKGRGGSVITDEGIKAMK